MIRVRSVAAVLVVAACSGSSSRTASAPGAPGLAPAREPGAEASGAGAGGSAGAGPSEAGAGGAMAAGAMATGAASGPGPSSAAAPAILPAPATPGVKVTLADVGLEAASLDRTADPCIDFYQFACGGWLQNNPVPADRARVSRFTEIDDRNQQALQAILEEAAGGATGDAATKKLGGYYASCMDAAAIERGGLAAIRPVLAKTRGVKDARSWLAAIVELHKLGIFAVWDHVVLGDFQNAAMATTYLDAAGLTLPDREDYLSDEHKALRAGFQQHVGRMLALLPPPPGPRPAAEAAADAAADVVAIETEIARLTKSAAEQRDLAAAYHPTDLRGLGKQATSVDWPRYFQGLGAAPSKRIIVGTPRLFAGLDALRARFKPAQWASYFTYQLLERMAFALPAAFDAEAFALEALVSGVERPRERSRRCVDATARALPELLGPPFVARYFPGSAKQDATRVVDAVVAALTAELASADWLGDATRQAALAKLGKLTRMVGYPERWKTYDFDVKRDDFAGNQLRAAAFDTRRRLAKAGKPVDRGEWQMTVFGAGAYYNPGLNHMVVPAGLLQRPLFGQDRTVAANLGGIGEVIGHELSHAFDDHGAQFDADGNLRRWWQPADLARFTERAACVAEQYATFEALPKKRIQAQLTLGENIADLGGAKLAFQAYRALRKDATKTYVADGLTEDQQFFVGLGQAACQRDRPAEAERRLATDPHAPAKFRVYGALRNLPAFAEAFHCAAGTPMRPAKPCAVW